MATNMFGEWQQDGLFPSGSHIAFKGNRFVYTAGGGLDIQFTPKHAQALAEAILQDQGSEITGEQLCNVCQSILASLV
jgi:hypothetical protein